MKVSLLCNLLRNVLPLLLIFFLYVRLPVMAVLVTDLQRLQEIKADTPAGVARLVRGIR